MTTNCQSEFRYGFRVVGSPKEARRLICWADAFQAHLEADPKAQLDKESFLSAFCFGSDFQQHMQVANSPKGFAGPCSTPWLPVDLDADGNLDLVLKEARRLVLFLGERYRTLKDDSLLVCFSGCKGFSLYVPVSLFDTSPSIIFNQVCRRLVEGWAGKAELTTIDMDCYDKQRLFRSPNSKHMKTGLYKIPLTFDELQGLSLDGIKNLAQRPRAFEMPDQPALCPPAVNDWREAEGIVRNEAAAKAQRNVDTEATINRKTWELIANPTGIAKGERHRTLFSAAANLAEFSSVEDLVYALLGPPGLDTGLPPSEVQRQIRCGLEHSKANHPGNP